MDAVAQVRDALRELLDIRSGQPADQFELDVVGRHVVEQSSALPEQDRYDVQFQLVQLPCQQQCLRRPGPVHHDIRVPGCGAGPRGGLAGVGDVADASRWRVLRDVVGQRLGNDVVFEAYLTP